MNTQEMYSTNATTCKIQRRSERVSKRKQKGEENISKVVPKTVRKPNPKQATIQLLKELPAVDKSEVDMRPTTNGKRRCKRKSVGYEIDCSGIIMDTSDFQKDLWNRAKDGKFNVAKNVRIKRKGNIILIRSSSYISKKCVRSNIHFLTTIYLKKKKIDRTVHVVGTGNKYKIMYK